MYSSTFLRVFFSICIRSNSKGESAASIRAEYEATKLRYDAALEVIGEKVCVYCMCACGRANARSHDYWEGSN